MLAFDPTKSPSQAVTDWAKRPSSRSTGRRCARIVRFGVKAQRQVLLTDNSARRLMVLFTSHEQAADVYDDKIRDGDD